VTENNIKGDLEGKECDVTENNIKGDLEGKECDVTEIYLSVNRTQLRVFLNAEIKLRFPKNIDNFLIN
jgi:hypothetical protein